MHHKSIHFLTNFSSAVVSPLALLMRHSNPGYRAVIDSKSKYSVREFYCTRGLPWLTWAARFSSKGIQVCDHLIQKVDVFLYLFMNLHLNRNNKVHATHCPIGVTQIQYWNSIFNWVQVAGKTIPEQSKSILLKCEQWVAASHAHESWFQSLPGTGSFLPLPAVLSVQPLTKRLPFHSDLWRRICGCLPLSGVFLCRLSSWLKMWRWGNFFSMM